MSIGAISGSSLTRFALSASGVSAVAPGTDAGSPSSAESLSSAAQAAFVSPVVKYDSIAKVAVLYFRDGGTGDVYQQIPAEKVLKEYRLRGGRSIERTPVVRNALGAVSAGAVGIANDDTARATGNSTSPSSGSAAVSSAGALSSGAASSSSAPAASAPSVDTGAVGSTLSVSV